MKPKKSLGQHWLDDRVALNNIVNAAELTNQDVVLEIGPGQGTLTKLLVAQAKKVIAVELDPELVAKLPNQITKKNLEVIQADILKFDLSGITPGYKVVANIPYYLTSKLLRVLSESTNPPVKMVLLVQKEVAERICAQPGQMSILAISTQLYYKCQLGQIVPAQLFKPPPKIDSQIVILDRHPQPLFANLDDKKFFRIVKAGFSERRKKLRSSLAGGLNLSKDETDTLLKKSGINGDCRAQELTLGDWRKLTAAS